MTPEGSGVTLRVDKYQCISSGIIILIHTILFLIYALQKSIKHKWVKKFCQKENEDRKESKMDPAVRLVHKTYSLEMSHKSGLTHSTSKRRGRQKHRS